MIELHNSRERRPGMGGENANRPTIAMPIPMPMPIWTGGWRKANILTNFVAAATMPFKL